MLDTICDRDIARVAVAAEMVNIVIVLEQTMMCDDPAYLRADIGAQDRGRDLRMIIRGKLIADIMN